MKILRSAIFLVASLLSATVAADDLVVYYPLQANPSPWYNAEAPGPLKNKWYTIDFPGLSAQQIDDLSSCSITVYGPPTNYFVYTVSMYQDTTRICSIDRTIGPLLVQPESAQIAQCQIPSGSFSALMVDYSFSWRCPYVNQ